MLAIVFALLSALPTFACHGPDSEKAQLRDASIVFVGDVESYVLRKGGVTGITSRAVAKLSFRISKTLKGEHLKTRVIYMRGDTLPNNLAEFKTRFGSPTTVGARFFNYPTIPAEYKSIPFVVDAACSMNGEDWYLRKP